MVYPRILAVVIVLATVGCSSRAAPAPEERLRLWHAFNAGEAEALGRALAAWQRAGNGPVEPVQETFARGQTMLRRILESETDCPDLARIDATWLPALARAGLLHPVPDQVGQGRALVPGAAALATVDRVRYGVPQAIDGLALVYREDAVAALGPAWPPRSADELVARARALTTGGRFGLGVRDDGYWFVAFLRAWGGDIVDPATGSLGIDTPASRHALERFAALFGTVAPRPPPPGTAAEDERRRFRDRELAVVVAGPWSMIELSGGDVTGLGVAALPGAPLGGQILVVPSCARAPERAFRLAEYLTSPAIQAEWARLLGVIPPARDGLERAGAFVQKFHRALEAAEPLPRHPITAELFEDLGPAVSRVVAGEATAEEALAAVARAWARLLRQHGIEPRPFHAAVAP